MLFEGRPQMRSDNLNRKKPRESDVPTSGEPTEEVPLPDIYAEINWSPRLTLEQDSSNDDKEPGGFNPYDTAVLHKR